MKNLLTIFICLIFCPLGFSQKISEKFNVINDNYINIPGTGFYIIPPDSFEVSPTFIGLHDPSTQSYITLSYTNTPMNDLLLSEKSADASLKVLETEKFTYNKYEATFSKIAKEENGITSHKWILIYGNNNETIKVMGIFPENSKKDLSEKIKTSVLTVIHK